MTPIKKSNSRRRPAALFANSTATCRRFLQTRPDRPRWRPLSPRLARLLAANKRPGPSCLAAVSTGHRSSNGHNESHSFSSSPERPTNLFSFHHLRAWRRKVAATTILGLRALPRERPRAPMGGLLRKLPWEDGRRVGCPQEARRHHFERPVGGNVTSRLVALFDRATYLFIWLVIKGAQHSGIVDGCQTSYVHPLTQACVSGSLVVPLAYPILECAN